MKKIVKKFGLNREVVRHLTAARLSAAVGGAKNGTLGPQSEGACGGTTATGPGWTHGRTATTQP